jgi:hypothetical protein
VTWTLQSNHLSGRAADIISHGHGWNDPKFFAALRVQAKQWDLLTITKEGCHVQG